MKTHLTTFVCFVIAASFLTWLGNIFHFGDHKGYGSTITHDHALNSSDETVRLALAKIEQENREHPGDELPIVSTRFTN